MSAKTASRGPRYEPEERPPFIVTVGVGLQNAFLGLAPFVVLPLIVVGAAGGSQALGLWTVFATMASIGVTTLLMTVRYGPVGVGCNVLPGVSPTAIPFCILALVDGGPGTLAALVIAAGLFRMALSMRLSLLRRVVTPTVSGTIMILLIITITPLFFKLMYDVPAGAPTAAAPVCALTTFVVMVGILLRTSGALAMWAPAIGIVAGGVAAVAFGIYDLETLKQAPWVGLPLNGWSGFGFDFGMTFWTLLPAFAFVSVIDLIQTNAMSLSALRVSWREPRAIDFRRIEGGAMSNGLGTLLAGIWGGIPLTTGPRGSMIALQTGCASRDIGIFIGVACLVLAFFPKAWGLVSIIPGPVVAVYLILIMAPLLIEGMRTIIQDEFDYRKGLMVGVATMVGLGFQFDMVTLPIGGLWGSMFQQGLTTGGITMVLLTLFTELTGQGRSRIQAELHVESLPRINAFLKNFSSSRGWNDEMTDRLHAVAEETLLILAPQNGNESADENGDGNDRRRLLVVAGSDGPAAELEFISAPSHSSNLEDRIALLKKPVPEIPEFESMVERDVSLRLLRYYASSVSHQQYHDTEVITVRVSPRERE